jgi:hypothetical protein
LVEIDHLPCPNGPVDFWVVNSVEVVVDGFWGSAQERL